MGPCWITIKGAQPSHERSTWCDFEIQTEPKFIEISTEDRNREAPTLSVLSLALKTHKNLKTK